jgi:heat shock protein HslJ
LGGEYKVENTFKITFSKVISTMMACEDMKTEQEFSKVLEMTDNFIVDGKILSLNKGRMTPLARFELIK